MEGLALTDEPMDDISVSSQVMVMLPYGKVTNKIFC